MEAELDKTVQLSAGDDEVLGISEVRVN